MTYEHVKRRIKSELTDDQFNRVLDVDIDGPAYGVIGIDESDRVVAYFTDGVLSRTDPDGHQSTDLKCYIPHTAERAVLALDTDDWTWIHPRYRWL